MKTVSRLCLSVPSFSSREGWDWEAGRKVVEAASRPILALIQAFLIMKLQKNAHPTMK